MRILGPPDNPSAQKAHTASKPPAQTKEAQAAAQHEVQGKQPSSPAPPAPLAVVVSAEAKAADASRTKLESDVEKRIQTVKAQIASGTYKVDADRLAGKLVDEESARRGKK
ncbi:MAG: flagellar biosynthesis anti-sigma factor FlgM [Myxococcota bacterium]